MGMSSAATRGVKTAFTNITNSESSRTEILVDGASVSPGSYLLDGVTVHRSSGAESSLTITVRVYDASTGGAIIFFDTVTLDNNGESAGTFGMGLSFEGGAGLFFTLEASAGSDTDGNVLVTLKPVRRY